MSRKRKKKTKPRTAERYRRRCRRHPEREGHVEAPVEAPQKTERGPSRPAIAGLGPNVFEPMLGSYMVPRKVGTPSQADDAQGKTPSQSLIY